MCFCWGVVNPKDQWQAWQHCFVWGFGATDGDQGLLGPSGMKNPGFHNAGLSWTHAKNWDVSEV